MSSPSGELLERLDELRNKKKISQTRGMLDIIGIIEDLVLLQQPTPETAPEPEVVVVPEPVAEEPLETIKPADVGSLTESASPSPAPRPERRPRPGKRVSIMEVSSGDLTRSEAADDDGSCSDGESTTCSVVISAGGAWDLTKNFPSDVSEMMCKKCTKAIERDQPYDAYCEKCLKLRLKEMKKRRKYEEKIRKAQIKKVEKLRKLAGSEEEAAMLQRAIVGEAQIVGTADADALREKIKDSTPDQWNINLYV